MLEAISEVSDSKGVIERDSRYSKVNACPIGHVPLVAILRIYANQFHVSFFLLVKQVLLIYGLSQLIGSIISFIIRMLDDASFFNIFPFLTFTLLH